MSAARAPVTAVLLTWNEERNIRRALESILRGTLLPEAILVVDNGSTDRTLAVVEAIAQAHPAIAIRWLVMDENNLGAARAAAVEAARTELVAFLDADCEAPPSWLERLVAGFRFYDGKFGSVAGVGAPASPPAAENEFYDSVRLMTSIFLGHLNSPQARPPVADREAEHLPGGNLLLQRERTLMAGNFSASFAFVCEDVELGNRLRARGFRLFFLEAPVATHRFGTGISEWTDRMYRFGLGQMLVARVFPRHLGFRLALPLLFVPVYVSALVGSIFAPHLLWLPFLYFVTIGVTAGVLCRRRSAGELWPNVFLLFLATHFAYALGEWVGFARYFLPALIRRAFAVELPLEKRRSRP